jgi:multiple sugar transport system permease protein
MNKKPFFSRFIGKTTFTHLALIFVCVFAMLPIATTILISFKTQAEIVRKPPVVFPCDTETSKFTWSECRWAVEGYQRVLAPKPKEGTLFGWELTGNMINTYIPNSFMYASITAVTVSILASLAGFAFSRFKFRGHDALLAGVMAITGVPLLTNILALYQMAVKMRKGLPFFDDRFFLIFVYLGFFMPISVWILKGFFDAIPPELEEASIIDGTTRVGALFRITMPLALPGMASVFLLTFVNVWNEFIVSYLLVSKNEFKPAMFGLYDFLSQNVINMQVLAAACILIAGPIVILFFFTRKTFFRAMAEGAVKG